MLVDLEGSELPKMDVYLGLLFEKPETCQALVLSVKKTEGGLTDYKIRIAKARHYLVPMEEGEGKPRILARQVRLEHDGCIYQLLVMRQSDN